MTYISDAGRTGSDKPRRSLTITPSMKTTTCLRSSPCSSSTKACACALPRNAAPSTSRSVAPLTSAGGQWTWRCKLAVNTTVAIGVMVCPAGDRNQWVKSISLSLALQRLWRTPSVVPAVALLRKNCLNVAVCHVPFRSSYDRASSWLRFVYNRSSYPGVSRSLGFPRHARFSANRLLRVRPVATRHRGSAPYRSALATLVLATVVAAPTFELIALCYLLLPLHYGRPPRHLPFAFRILQRVREWSLVDVFLLGMLVTLIKLKPIVTVVPGVALWALGGAMRLLAAVASTIDVRELWARADSLR